ncbi:MAG: trigger factor [Pseudomonadota bacterium]
MQVTETNTDGLKRAYKVIISADDISQRVDGRLEELRGQVKVPGFRPGKVPLTIMKQRFGASVMGEVLEKTVKDSSTEALTERGLRPAGQPKIEVVSFDEGKDLEYTIDLEVLPDIEVMDFSKIELERLKIAAPEDEVGAALEQIAKQRKTTKPLARARKSKSGDVLVIDFAGTVDGEALPGMAGDDHHLELGSGSFIPGFEDQLTGAKAGEEKDVVVTFPEAYGNEKLAGREAVFKCTVKEILESIPAEIDDSLAEALGEENLDSLKAKVKEEIDQQYVAVARARMKRQMLDQLADGHDFQVPQTLVDVEFEAIWRQVQADREQGREDPDDAGKDEEQLKSEYRDIAERRVRLGLLLAEVGRQNEIEVSQEEMGQALMREAQRYPGQEQQVFQFYQSNQEAMAQLRAPVYEDKVVDFISELAKVTERDATPDDLKEEGDDASDESGADDKKATKKKTAAKKPAKKAAAKKTTAKKAETSDESQDGGKKKASTKKSSAKEATTED